MVKKHTEGVPRVGTTRIVVVTSGKGGVGKTTITANLGVALARLGQRVVLIDADAGLRNLDLVLGLENRVLHTARDVLEGLCRVDQAFVRDPRWKNLALLPLARGRQRLRRTREARQGLVSAIETLGFEWVFLDCPAGIDVGFATAIAPAKEAVLVTTPEITSLRDADRVAAILESQGVEKIRVLVNRLASVGPTDAVGTTENADRLGVQEVQEALGLEILGTIPDDPTVLSATNRGTPLVASPRLSPAALALEQAARKLLLSLNTRRAWTESKRVFEMPFAVRCEEERRFKAWSSVGRTHGLETNQALDTSPNVVVPAFEPAKPPRLGKSSVSSVSSVNVDSAGSQTSLEALRSLGYGSKSSVKTSSNPVSRRF